MSKLMKLAELMRRDWNRRVHHDYRFWMSDGYQDDAQMWATGERDFQIIGSDIKGGIESIALEIGCGVGRMLPAAARKFGRVVGVDISERAVQKAQQLLREQPQIELVVGSGFDLQPIASASIDFVWSFAALTSMPTRVIAAYLAEMRRVLKASGVARLHVYLGEQLSVGEGDTLHARSFSMANFKAGVECAGLVLQQSKPLVLPIPVSFKECGLEAMVVTLAPGAQAAQSVDDIAAALLPQGEPEETSETSPSDLEAWMTLRRAEELADAGDRARAAQALEYVVQHCKAVTVDVSDILTRIVEKIENGSELRGASDSAAWSGELFEQNLLVVRDRFPQLHAQLSAAPSQCADAAGVSVRTTSQGPVVWRAGICLDHAEKPRAAAEVWVDRAVREARVAQAAGVVVLGFGAGYHLERMVECVSGTVSCVEPSLAALRCALGIRDLRPMLARLKALQIGEPSADSNLTADDELLVRPQSVALDPQAVERCRAALYGRRGLAQLQPRIAVLGPFAGGTGPIAQYTHSALARNKQLAKGFDMSGFNSAFQLLDGFVQSDQRRGMMRNMYVEMVSQLLLESLSEKPIDILLCMAQAPITPRALTELRRRGVITVMWFVEDYLRFTYWREMAQYYDFVFTIQKGECLDAIKKAGAGEAHYLATACDPNFHTPMLLNPEDQQHWGSPISFVGAGYHNRQQMFASLANRPFKIWGSEWPLCRPFDRLVQEQSRRIAPEEYIKIFNATEINLNLHSSTERDGVEPNGDFLNPRTFELAACGAFQLIDPRTLLPEAFEVGSEMITFSNLAELNEKIDYYLAHPEERRLVAERARARALRDHTYDKRIEQMLSVIYASRYEQLRTRQDRSPWSTMIARSAEFPELKERCVTAAKRGEEPTLDALVSDIVTGKGKLTETEQKLLFLFHVRKQIIRMTAEENGGSR